MTIAEIVKKYNISLVDGVNIRVCNAGELKRSGMLETIKSKKPEIVAYLTAEQEVQARAKAERDAKIANIEGLAELKDALRAENEYHVAFRKMMDDEYNDGAVAPEAPAANSRILKGVYPRAAAYIKAESWFRSANFVKSGAGKKAMERIINGEDSESVIRDMEKEFGDHCARNMWD